MSQSSHTLSDNHGTEANRGPRTLAEVLQASTLEFPERVALAFETETDSQEQWTYRDLDQRARVVAAWLGERAKIGDRALLVYPPGLEFIAAFLGCVYAGVLPVPAGYPKQRRPSPRLDAIVKDCQPRLALTCTDSLAAINLEGQSSAVQTLRWEATDRLDSLRATDYKPISCQPDDLAFLQYTSGSTASPRGVMVSHRNLMHNLESIREGFALASGESRNETVETAVFWLPAYHDMGLIGGILTPLYVGGTSYLLPPAEFLRRPLSWLETISRTQSTISGAPNFGYELCVRKTTPEQRAALDLSSWRLAFCGAEPICKATLDEFAEAFQPAGFHPRALYPCYGLAESTLLVTGGQESSGPPVVHVDKQKLREDKKISQVEPSHAQALPLVSCGKPLGQLDVSIVDPQSRLRCGEGSVGEVWIRGESVARGYWNQEGLSEETFQASIGNENGAPFLRTGDLGFQWEGQLHIAGRLKDLIIIRGRNHFPNDIEKSVQQVHKAIDLGVAFAVEGQRQEQLVVIHQIHREHRRANLDEAMRAIRSAIVEEHEIDPFAIVLLRPASLPLTSSGKVKRDACRQLYMTGDLPISAEWINSEETFLFDPESELLIGHSANGLEPARPEFLNNAKDADVDELTAEIQAWLLDWLAIRGQVPIGSLEPTMSFAELGIDSLTAVELSLEMVQVLELQLPPGVAGSYTTPASLSRYLAQQLSSQS